MADHLQSAKGFAGESGYSSIHLQAFTLLELLVSMSVMAILMAILVPALGKVKNQAKSVRSMSNQRQIIDAVTMYSSDNNNRYPGSVATIAAGPQTKIWNWQEPTMMAACRSTASQQHRSMSGYIGSYIKDADVMHSPSSPEKHEYLQAAWDAGDDWDNPVSRQDSFSGTYCFYWNYVGNLGYGKAPFRGPDSASGGRGRSKLLITEYFGYGHSRNKDLYGHGNYDAFGSSVKIGRGGDVVPSTSSSSAYWALQMPSGRAALDSIKVPLNAGFTDGHVESYHPSKAVELRVSMTQDGSRPYPDGIGLGPGTFFIPRSGASR